MNGLDWFLLSMVVAFGVWVFAGLLILWMFRRK
jgi:hypothetical protein